MMTRLAIMVAWRGVCGFGVAVFAMGGMPSASAEPSQVACAVPTSRS